MPRCRRSTQPVITALQYSTCLRIVAVYLFALSLASQGCTHSWTAQAHACLQQYGIGVPVVDGEPISIAPSGSCIHAAVMHAGSHCLLTHTCAPHYGPTFAHIIAGSPGLRAEPLLNIGTCPSAMQSRTDSSDSGWMLITLPVEVGCHLWLPCSRKLCHMCPSGALCDYRHVLQECPALVNIRASFPDLTIEFSWGHGQACVDRGSAHCQQHPRLP